VNLEDIIDPEYGLQQDEWSLSKPRFGEGGQLEVVGWSGMFTDKSKLYIVKVKDGCYIRVTKSYLFISRFVDIVSEPKREKLREKITYNWRKLRKRTCHHCKISYQPVRKDQKFCSNYCKIECKTESVKNSFHETKAFHPDTKFWRSERLDSRGCLSYWHVSCPECGEIGESKGSTLQQGCRPCACSKHRQQECYINWIIGEHNNAVGIKFGIANNSKQRIKSQNRQSSYEVRQHQVYTFPTVQSCKQAERECKKELDCGVVLKRDMPDGWTETTSVLNLSKVVGIYKRNGGVLNGLNKVVVAAQASSVVTPVKLSYTTYVNTPMSVIMEYSLHNPKVYVIVFYTLDYVGTDDWDESLGKSWATRVLSPVWVVSKKEMELHVNHFLTFDGTTKDNWEVV